MAFLGTHHSAVDRIDWSLPASALSKRKWRLLYGLGRAVPLVRRELERWTVAQKISVADQIRAGVRFLDIRVAEFGDTFYVAHTFPAVPLSAVTEDVRAALADVPRGGPALLVHVRPDWENRGGGGPFFFTRALRYIVQEWRPWIAAGRLRLFAPISSPSTMIESDGALRLNWREDPPRTDREINLLPMYLDTTGRHVVRGALGLGPGSLAEAARNSRAAAAAAVASPPPGIHGVIVDWFEPELGFRSHHPRR